MEKSSDLNSYENSENSVENLNVGYSSYKVKYITKSGEIKYYEYKSKLLRIIPQKRIIIKIFFRREL